jgi:hypothetical protein
MERFIKQNQFYFWAFVFHWQHLVWHCTVGLTPKIPFVFLTNFCSFWPSWRIPLLYQKKMRIWRSNHRILKLSCWTSTSKNYNSSFHGISEIITFKHQSIFFFWMFFTMNFFTPKLMKIRWSYLFFGSLAPHFQIKLSIQGSNLNSKFVSMSEVELFLLTRVFTPNFNTVDLVKFLEKNQNLHIQIVAVTLKVASYRTMSKKKKWKKWKTKILWAKQTIFWTPRPSALGQFQPHGCM